jgi:hypothetical protein
MLSHVIRCPSSPMVCTTFWHPDDTPTIANGLIERMDLTESEASSADKVPKKEPDLLEWLAQCLREAYPQMEPDQIKPHYHSVCIKFAVSGLSVDVVPVEYKGDPDDRGYLFPNDGGEPYQHFVASGIHPEEETSPAGWQKQSENKAFSEGA